jgi:F-type H+-transporting ATPase subunit gamma
MAVRDIKQRIGSVRNVKQITHAMYAIAMTRVFKMKTRLAATRRYADTLQETIQHLLHELEDPSHSLLEAKGDSIGILVLNSDRGLCGRFKGDLNRTTRDQANKSANPKLMLGGDKARVFFENEKFEILKQYVKFYDDPEYDQASAIAGDLMSFFTTGAIKELHVVYMRFINDFKQEVKSEKILPLMKQERSPELAKEEDKHYLAEPSVAVALDQIAPHYLRAKIYRMLMESKTSEYAIRRTAMKSATDNAAELIDELNLQYNKARQQEITRAIADIIGGTEALRKQAE